MSADVPDFCASSADIGSPVKIISMARDFPTARGRRCVPPAPTKKKKNVYNLRIWMTVSILQGTGERRIEKIKHKKENTIKPGIVPRRISGWPNLALLPA